MSRRSRRATSEYLATTKALLPPPTAMVRASACLQLAWSEDRMVAVEIAIKKQLRFCENTICQRPKTGSRRLRDGHNASCSTCRSVPDGPLFSARYSPEYRQGPALLLLLPCVHKHTCCEGVVGGLEKTRNAALLLVSSTIDSKATSSHLSTSQIKLQEPECIGLLAFWLLPRGLAPAPRATYTVLVLPFPVLYRRTADSNMISQRITGEKAGCQAASETMWFTPGARSWPASRRPSRREPKA
ncbi:hypothetical protein BD289DRAFT_290389 [Coniella lustricola]|uniref:Uncharacterized protein n=1 Tax=Coniella lustricola TaxID=2025994 RepID=A0A2T3A5C0_9PEZI|nr:hypothetical protein BD289DRAFT_290389 [Coniella lustricola]